MRLNHSLVALALFSIAMTGCSWSPKPSIESVPEAHRAEVKKSKLLTGAEIKGILDSSGVQNFESITIDGTTYTEKDIEKNLDLSAYTNDMVDIPFSVKADGQEGSGRLKMYQQPYSVIGGLVDNAKINQFYDDTLVVKGIHTKENHVPKQGTATYSGKAFSSESTGLLTYHVDFDKKVGSGEIIGLNTVAGLGVGNVLLKAAPIASFNHTVNGENIKATGIQGQAVAGRIEGDYKLGFAGPKAEEIIGSVSVDNHDLIGFGGKR